MANFTAPLIQIVLERSDLSQPWVNNSCKTNTLSIITLVQCGSFVGFSTARRCRLSSSFVHKEGNARHTGSSEASRGRCDRGHPGQQLLRVHARAGQLGHPKRRQHSLSHGQKVSLEKSLFEWFFRRIQHSFCLKKGSVQSYKSHKASREISTSRPNNRSARSECLQEILI